MSVTLSLMGWDSLWSKKQNPKKNKCTSLPAQSDGARKWLEFWRERGGRIVYVYHSFLSKYDPPLHQQEDRAWALLKIT